MPGYATTYLHIVKVYSYQGIMFFCDHCFKVKSKERFLKKAIMFKESSVNGIIRVLCLISKGCNIACDGCTSAGPENCNTCSAGFYPVGGICRGKFPSALNKT